MTGYNLPDNVSYHDPRAPWQPANQLDPGLLKEAHDTALALDELLESMAHEAKDISYGLKNDVDQIRWHVAQAISRLALLKD